MTEKVIVFEENDLLTPIAKEMRQRNAGSAIIVKDDKPVGIITERDFSQKVVAESVNPNQAFAKQVMTSPLVFISPDADVNYVSKIMESKNIKKMPVVKNEKLIGIVTQTDVNKYFTEQRKKFVLEHLSKNSREKYPY